MAVYPAFKIAQLMGVPLHLPSDIAGVNATYTASIVDTDRNVFPTVFVKDLNQKQLANELISSALAKHLGLPIPTPFIILASPQDRIWVHAPVLDNYRVLFGCAAVQPAPATIFHLLRQTGLIPSGLLSWSKLGDAVAFDEWIANIDRHLGNLMMSSDGVFWLIDHSHVLSGCAWQPAHLLPDKSFANRLAATLNPMLAALEKANATSNGIAAVAGFAQAPVNDICDAEPVSHLLTAEERAAVKSFLISRPAHLGAMIPLRFA